MSWKTPETSSGEAPWNDVNECIDDNLDTWASCSILPDEYCPYLYIGFNKYILCKTIRLYITTSGGDISSIYLQAYIDDEWVLVYSGQISKSQWWEVDLDPNKPQRVKEIRMLFYNYEEEQTGVVRVVECDFNQIIVRPLVNGSLAGNGLVGKRLVR